MQGCRVESQRHVESERTLESTESCSQNILSNSDSLCSIFFREHYLLRRKTKKSVTDSKLRPFLAMLILSQLYFA